MTGSPDIPEKLFDRSTVGQTTPVRPISIDRRHLVLFAEAIGETAPDYLDQTAAQAAGYKDVLAPPTFAAVVDMAAQHDMRREGAADIHKMINADFRFLLHGEETYDYVGQMFAGDVVAHQTKVLGFSDAAGGRMEIARSETTLSEASRGVLVRCKRTLIHNLKQGGGA